MNMGKKDPDPKFKQCLAVPRCTMIRWMQVPKQRRQPRRKKKKHRDMREPKPERSTRSHICTFHGATNETARKRDARGIQKCSR